MTSLDAVTSWIVVLAVVAVALGDKSFGRNVIDLLKSFFQDDDHKDK